MKKEVGDLNNKYRVLLTEVLPYELPIGITNLQFYKNMQDDSVRRWFEELFKGTGLFVPFNYYVRRSGGVKSRLLSVMHPYSQLKVADFYEEFSDYLIYLCYCRKTFSLRHIDKVAKCIFNFNVDDKEEDSVDMNDEGNGVEVDADIVCYDEKKYKSYFTYKDYDVLYKFFDSVAFFRIEQKFRYFRTLDIASCFYHIYTHSISWAVKSKEYSKKNLKSSHSEDFESKIDNLMYEMNYKETNGILVGPEFSRIFAEIILQRIDQNVLDVLNTRYELSPHNDYEIKRYVDDYMVFSNELSTIDKIEQAYKEELEKYKLYLNSKKRETFERPFVSNISVAKAGGYNLFVEFTTKMHNKETGTYHAAKARGDFKSYISKFELLVKQSCVTFDVLNGYQLVLFKNFVLRNLTPYFCHQENEKDPDVLYNILEICFFIFSLDMNTSASYKLCRIIESIYAISKYDINVEEEVKQIISREMERCLDIYQAQVSDKDTNIEVMNLLITIDSSAEIFFDAKYLMRLFNIKEDNIPKADRCKHLNYFQICTLLQIIKNEQAFSDIKEMIQDEVMKRFVSHKEDWRSHAELVMLLLDWQTCPYIKNSDKVKLLEILNCANARKWFKNVDGWFFDWKCKPKIKDLLSKKEYHNVYE